MKRPMMLKCILCMVAILIITMVMIGCKTTQATTTTAAETTAAETTAAETTAAETTAAAQDDSGKQYVVGISMATQESAYWQAMMVQWEETAKEIGNVEVKYLVAENDVNLQNQQIETFVSQKVDAIITVCRDDKAVLSAVKKCNEAGIPFIFADRPVESTDDIKVSYGAATDNYNTVVNAAEWLVDYAKNNNTVLKALEWVGLLTDLNAIARSDGWNDVAEENPDVLTIVQSVPGDWQWDKSYAGTKNAFEANPDINCILAGSCGYWPAAANALKELDKYAVTGEPNHVFWASVDGEPYTVKAVKEGYVDAIGVQPNLESAKRTLEAAIILADGGAMDEPYIFIPGFVLNQENFDEKGPMAYGYAEMDDY